ncbi:MAG: hypothetical protein ABIX01_16440 [Chitinophagaceae bacterium]
MVADLKFIVEPLDIKVWLVIIKNGQEIGCRMEFRKKLIVLLGEVHVWIFKGRVQLRHRDGLVEIYFKKQLVGTVQSEVFMKMLNARQ